MSAADALSAALALARGSYQRGILAGRQAWSGADLRGRAGRWGASYARSRRTLLYRIQAAGIPARIEIGAHGRLSLVLGS